MSVKDNRTSVMAFEADNEKLFKAIRNGNLSVVKDLIESGRVECNASHENSGNKSSTLHVAVVGCQLDIVRYLIRSEVDIDRGNAKGVSPLHAAAAFGYLEILKMLIANGADCNVVDDNGDSPLHYAACENQADVIRYMATRKSDINKRNNDGASPLHKASASGDLKVFKLLIKLGADYNALNNFGDSCLFFAAKKGHADIVRFLIEDKMVDVNICNKNRAIPLHSASKRGKLDVVKLLIQKGADPNAIDIDGNTPVHCAVANSHTKTVKCLIDIENVKLNISNKTGCTALDLAYESGDSEITNLLIEKGADSNKCKIS